MRWGWALVLPLLLGCGRLFYGADGETANDAVDAAAGLDAQPVEGLCATTTALQPAPGYRHMCAVVSGRLYCWGHNEFGQLGLGAAAMGADTNTPGQVGSDADWFKVGAGLRHSCALRCNGELWCWGQNDQGQLATGEILPGGFYPEPTRASTTELFVDLWVKRNHGCALTAAGTLWCWGSNGSRQLGTGNNIDATVPTQVLIVSPQSGADDQWIRAGLGDDHTCATHTTGSLWCWGSNGNGQLGQGGVTPVREYPSQVGATLSWLGASSGFDASCAWKEDSLFCWGRNDGGQLGIGDSVDRDAPTQVSGTWQKAAFGYIHVCAIAAAGVLHCWGDATNGQLGLGPGVVSPVFFPTQVSAETDWTDVFAGDNYSCGLRQDQLFCWGENDTGKLGLGDNADRFDIAGPLSFVP